MDSATCRGGRVECLKAELAYQIYPLSTKSICVET